MVLKACWDKKVASAFPLFIYCSAFCFQIKNKDALTSKANWGTEAGGKTTTRNRFCIYVFHYQLWIHNRVHLSLSLFLTLTCYLSMYVIQKCVTMPEEQLHHGVSLIPVLPHSKVDTPLSLYQNKAVQCQALSKCRYLTRDTSVSHHTLGSKCCIRLVFIEH